MLLLHMLVALTIVVTDTVAEDGKRVYLEAGNDHPGRGHPQEEGHTPLSPLVLP